ncbi:hypothetical protein MtrunA17_Chr5g0422521 [Medicago truncatula]|uniref:Uncharacterized protein n=1 Tax=Medicago truncatula TaxID=3880 RepID=A0A396HWP1_MEDTR|nr:hypothetical protein MtrunA17_Chr5g0422521 [Medicago truncatula]
MRCWNKNNREAQGEEGREWVACTWWWKVAPLRFIRCRIGIERMYRETKNIKHRILIKFFTEKMVMGLSYLKMESVCGVTGVNEITRDGERVSSQTTTATCNARKSLDFRVPKEVPAT